MAGFFRKLLGKRSAPAGSESAGDGDGPVVLTLRDVDIARKFPQEIPDGAVGLKRGESHGCKSCGETLREVIITTGGPFGDPDTWNEYPLALDGWQCSSCEKITYPAFMTSDEMNALLEEAVGLSQRGAFDEAELAFRRAICSWTTYMPARLNFGAMYLDRIRAAQASGAPESLIETYLDEAEAQLRKALIAEPPPPWQLHFMLGKLLLRRGKQDEGAALLRQFLEAPDSPPSMRAHAEELLAGG